MTVAQAREQARKYGKLTEFNRLYREGFNADCALFNLDVPIILDGVEYGAGYGQVDWEDLVRFGKEFATGKGMHSGFRWLEDGFNEYFERHEKLVEQGKVPSFGGATGSRHNREVLAQKIVNELGNGVDGQHVLTEKQIKELKEGLKEVIERNEVNNVLKMK